jgi:hypothetical protein
MWVRALLFFFTKKALSITTLFFPYRLKPIPNSMPSEEKNNTITTFFHYTVLFLLGYQPHFCNCFQCFLMMTISYASYNAKFWCLQLVFYKNYMMALDILCLKYGCIKKPFFSLCLQVHVNLMILEARMQAELLYALRAIMRYMT